MHPTLVDQLVVTLQRLLPARWLGGFIYWLSRRRSIWLKNALIRGFTALFDVDTTEAARAVPDGYPSFNDFFTRELRADARPFTRDANQVISPVDGTIAQLGHARHGELIEAKGAHFSAVRLLGDAELAARFESAPFATLYLAPYNYHRIHMPLDGRLVATQFIPGKLYSVNTRTVAVIPDLYARNERLVCHFSGVHGDFILVLVGALNVASMATAWAGEIRGPKHGGTVRRHWPSTDAAAPRLRQGDYMGHFNMGSTVILLGPAARLDWNTDRRVGQPIKMGASLGRIGPAA
ncbi:MAG: archaetidylserine decarboxylase [Gammaproteobacteria bacterium]|jgi:phosphatidylserine decarboxylase|nr:archaetidylserine decarboxylase [Gammaproteobacteria bacterium]